MLSWIRVKGPAFALAFLRASSTAFYWITAKTRALTFMLSSRGSVGLSWIRVKGHALALAFLTAASTTLYWIAVRSRTFALSLLSRLSANVSWIGVRGHAFALSLASITSPQSRIDERVTGIRSPNASQPRGEGNELRSEGGIEPKVSARI